MRGVFIFALLAQVLCVRSETCADDLCAALQQDDSSGAVELLQVKSKQESKGDSKEDSTETVADAESKHGEEWVHYNPPGWRGGPGRGYVHHNPPGWRGGPGRGTTYVHHNPPGWRGGPGHGTTYAHHGGYGYRHHTTVYHHHGWRWDVETSRRFETVGLFWMCLTVRRICRHSYPAQLNYVARKKMALIQSDSMPVCFFWCGNGFAPHQAVLGCISGICFVNQGLYASRNLQLPQRWSLPLFVSKLHQDSVWRFLHIYLTNKKTACLWNAIQR